MNLGIVIPTINRKDLLYEAITFIDKMNVPVVIIDNGKQNLEVPAGFTLLEQDSNLGVAASWNVGIDAHADDVTHFLVLNDDIILYKTDIDAKMSSLINLIESNPDDFLVGNGTWCAFVIPRSIFDKVGKFYEGFFPAYFEDNDYYTRLRIFGHELVTSTILNPEVYRNSQTIAKDPSLNRSFDLNKKHFYERWPKGDNHPYKIYDLVNFSGDWRALLNRVSSLNGLVTKHFISVGGDLSTIVQPKWFEDALAELSVPTDLEFFADVNNTGISYVSNDISDPYSFLISGDLINDVNSSDISQLLLNDFKRDVTYNINGNLFRSLSLVERVGFEPTSD